MISSKHQYQITLERISQFATRLAVLEVAQQADPNLHVARNGAAGILAQLKREAAMWETHIREPVPDEPRRIESSIPVEQIDALSEQEYAEFARQTDTMLKRAQITNIDRQIALAEARIADWRRHRAWLEREIAALEASPVPV